ncbi:putative ABC transporter, P-loop containing nucleoside triphosphate hydrolase [Rosa chinensis]|uniref:Putative ABC transporter, P-loop containing nucleoside triphosphate hydrolase n=1 Tax=Rosa chinensis TaxID=74649 RepID=A0A2P6SK75_ROSCH|nr:putative ABC transporter, P-loop containing nucleoside triphosphate hydrolase [Rosa chinensis]
MRYTHHSLSNGDFDRNVNQKQPQFSLNGDCGAVKLTGFDKKLDVEEGVNSDKMVKVNSRVGIEFHELESISAKQDKGGLIEDKQQLINGMLEFHALQLFDKMPNSEGLCDARSTGLCNARRTIIAPISIRDKGGGLTTHREVVDASDEMVICSVNAKQDDDGFAEDKKQVSGSVTYNGHDMHEFVPQRSAAYSSQHDVHIGEMTVAETLALSVRCQGAGTRYEMLEELSRREKEARIKLDIDLDIYMKGIASESQRAVFITSYILKILGQDGYADTLVGDQMIRGISGGQKKCVTTGEMSVGPAKALFMDEISTGLDSSTTYQIVNSIKQFVHILHGTAFISLLQPPPETYDLFDDIILLSDGQIVYQGPREYVLDFFKSMGFKCPERKCVADFLQEVTSKKDKEQYRGSRDDPYKFITIEEFS